MSPEKDAALCAEYPTLYEGRHGDESATNMTEGFRCDDGWFDIIRQLSGVIVAIAPGAVATCVKEKFGLLRFYTDCMNDGILLACDMASMLSSVTCERCGKRPAQFTSRHGERHGWIKTLCPRHAAEWSVPAAAPTG